MIGRWRRRKAPPCNHDVAAHSEATVRRLRAAATQPERFAAELMTLATCPVCAISVVAELIYSDAGRALTNLPAEPAQWGSCDHTFDPHHAALALSLAQDTVTASFILRPAADCVSCLLDLVFCQSQEMREILEAGRFDWRPMVEDRLLELFGWQV
jgi:hypothetical protein